MVAPAAIRIEYAGGSIDDMYEGGEATADAPRGINGDDAAT
jgi:hypothetical protein